MATCTTIRTGRKADERRAFARPAASTSASDEYPARVVAPGTVEPAEEGYDVVDYWGSGDPLSCLAAWG
jgi:hypothetical protein